MSVLSARSLSLVALALAAPALSAQTWPNLPAQFEPVQGLFLEDLDGHAGVVPPFLAVNALDALTGLPHPDAWCNLGQQGLPGMGTGGTALPPRQGAYCLEMGVDPNAVNPAAVRNGLVLGLNGAAAGNGTLELTFWVIDHGESNDPWDGVWVSDDGMNWTPVFLDWDTGIPDGEWTAVSGIDLSATGHTNGDFYLLFAAEGTDRLGDGGIQIDSIAVATGPLATGDVCTAGLAGGGFATPSTGMSCTFDLALSEPKIIDGLDLEVDDFGNTGQTAEVLIAVTGFSGAVGATASVSTTGLTGFDFTQPLGAGTYEVTVTLCTFAAGTQELGVLDTGGSPITVTGSGGITVSTVSGEEDEFLDGCVRIAYGAGGAFLQVVPPPVAGQTSTLLVRGVDPFDTVGFAYSLNGPGPGLYRFPGTLNFLSLDLTLPFTALPLVQANGNGEASLPLAVPGGSTGLDVWLQAYDVTSGLLIPGIMETVG